MKTTFYVRAIRHLKFEWNDNQHRSNKHNTHILHFSRFFILFLFNFFSRALFPVLVFTTFYRVSTKMTLVCSHFIAHWHPASRDDTILFMCALCSVHYPNRKEFLCIRSRVLQSAGIFNIQFSLNRFFSP